MACYALLIPDNGGIGIKRLRAICVEVGVLELAIYIYVLCQENNLERCQLSASLVFPWYRRCILQRALPRLCKSIRVHYFVHQCLLLVNQHSAQVFGIPSRRSMHDRAIHAESICQANWIWTTLCRKSTTCLCFSENLFEGAYTWYFIMVRGIGAIFSLSQWAPNSYRSVSFCTYPSLSTWSWVTRSTLRASRVSSLLIMCIRFQDHSY